MVWVWSMLAVELAVMQPRDDPVQASGGMRFSAVTPVAGVSLDDVTSSKLWSDSSLAFRNYLRTGAVLVLWFVLSLRLSFHGSNTFLAYHQSAPAQMLPMALNDSSQVTSHRPFLATVRFFVWQHRATMHEGQPHRLHIAPPDWGQLGHATATTVVTKIPFLTQCSSDLPAEELDSTCPPHTILLFRAYTR
ncbi:uncharacterized protein [Dermacentor albipictus]|uniref:uncharacterized protein isoform X4 n=1 Tax=Dermacentor albipictus TaxID=60249 RepID=UPI0038FC9D54